MTPPAPAGHESADGDEIPAEASDAIDTDAFGDGYEPV